MNDKIVTVDVREDIGAGRDPFSRIMDEAAKLRADEILRLIAPFEPVPLFHVMGRKGFQHTAERTSSGDWQILFAHRQEPASDWPCGCAKTHEGGNVTAETRASEVAGAAGGVHGLGAKIVEIDARHLEPPEPLMMVLEALAALPEEAQLHARTDRRPIHLCDLLEERGFVGQSEEQSDGSFLTQIRRR